MTLLDVRNLVTTFRTEHGVFRALDQVSFTIDAGECLGLVGESGSGKSVTALSILQLIPQPPGRVAGGQIVFAGDDLLAAGEAHMRQVRGRRISMIFQEPMTSLNPVFTIGEQIAEVYRIHEGTGRVEAKRRAIEMLELVRMPAASKRYSEYPHQLSGGMRQRVMIAMALACRPELLIADEPTTALDVTIQAQILDLIDQLRRELGMAVLFITHDLGVVAENCDRVLVMYGGVVVELAEAKSLFETPFHPYTEGLLRSIPRLGQRAKVLPTIEGAVPGLGKFPNGCRFLSRCPKKKHTCEQMPMMKELTRGHKAACWVAQESVT